MADPETTDDVVADDAPASGGSGDDLVITDDLDRTMLFGLDFVNEASLDPVVDAVLHGPRRDDERVPALLTPNVDILVQLDDAEGTIEERMFRRAQYVLPDGQPIIWVSRLLGGRLGARLPGSGLFELLWPRLVESETPVIVVASSDEVATRLGAEHGGAGFVVPPMFDADDHAAIGDIVDHVLAAARAARPQLVLVGIGHPKDARIIDALLERWEPRLGPKPLCLGLGGSFAMYLEFKRRAPGWVQRIGMEWFFRFSQEPRRLFHRYFVRDVAFIGIVWRAWRARDRA